MAARHGILNNELYIDSQVWNRLRFVKYPQTGNRISRLNPKSEWVTHEVPDLRLTASDPGASHPATGTGGVRGTCSPA